VELAWFPRTCRTQGEGAGWRLRRINELYQLAFAQVSETPEGKAMVPVAVELATVPASEFHVEETVLEVSGSEVNFTCVPSGTLVAAMFNGTEEDALWEGPGSRGCPRGWPM
jgi:hypothetical protein